MKSWVQLEQTPAIGERAPGAKAASISRSELFSRAATYYLDELDSESVTRRINLAVASLDEHDDSAADAVAAGHRLLDVTTGWW